MNWGGSADDLVASWWRPICAVMACATMCACALMFADTRTLTIGALAAIVAGAGTLRTIDKQTTASVTKSQMLAPTPLPTQTPVAKV